MIEPMTRATAVLTVAAVLLGAGCSRSRITTEIRPDGSYTRKLELAGAPKGQGMQMGTPLEETFALPEGPGWHSSSEDKESERNMTFTRSLSAGATLKGDLTIKESPDKVMLSNAVVITRPAAKRFEYRETLTWSGTPNKSLAAGFKEDDIADIRAALPKSLATEANARAVAQKAARLAVPMMFGPGEPLLAIGLMHPDLAIKRAGQRIGSLVLQALEQQFGDKMTAAERREVARRLIQATFNTARPPKPDPAAGPQSGEKSGGMIPLMFILKGPGKLVSSNGEFDDLNGEVYWALYPEAASLGPVVLTAVWEN